MRREPRGTGSSEGIGGTAMPAFKDRLSETERWDVVNFLKAFTPTER